MASEIVKTKVKKSTKKNFYEVKSPSLTATKIFLYGSSPEELENKTVKIDLTKNLRGKSLVLKLRVKSKEGSLEAELESIDLAISYIRRVMRKGTDYAEDSFEIDCRDCSARIKYLLVTRRKVSRTILNSLRQTAKKHLVSYIKTRDAEEIFSEIISNKLQKNLAQKLKKIYPLALCEIRVFTILRKTDRKPKEEKKEN